MIHISLQTYGRAKVLHDGVPIRETVLYTVSDGGLVNHTADAFLASMFAPSLISGQNIEVQELISAGLLKNLYRLQDEVYPHIYPHLKTGHIEIEAIPITPIESLGYTGVMFSAGLDSWHALLENLDRVDAIINSPSLSQRETGSPGIIRDIGHALGRPVISISHNWDDRHNMNIVPHKFIHIGTMISTAHHLSPRFDRIIYSITSPFSDEEFALWGHEKLQIEQYGRHISRLKKAEWLTKHEQWTLVAGTLRHCGQTDVGSLANCSHCEKCVRSMMLFKALGVLDKMPVYEKVTEAELLDDMMGFGKLACTFQYTRGPAPLSRRALDLRQDWLDIAEALGPNTSLGKAAYALANQ